MSGVRCTLGVGAALLLAACGGRNGIPSEGPGFGAAKTAVFLTDAPFPYHTVARVDIQVVSVALALDGDTSDTGPTWITVATPDRTINLLALQNGSTDYLGAAEDVPPGRYQAVRMMVDPTRSSITDRAGNVLGSTTTPGIDWQSKGDHPSLFAIVEEGMAIGENGADIVIDFDVGRSFLPDGHGGFLFAPSLRAITRSGSGGLTGQSSHEDGTPIPDAAVSVHQAMDTSTVLGPLVATSHTDATGRFTAAFLRPGQYQVVAYDLVRGLPSTPRDVRVTAGSTVDAGVFRW